MPINSLPQNTGTNANQVQGAIPDGAPANNYPVKVAGKDANGNVQTVLTNPDGSVVVSNPQLPPALTAAGGLKVSVIENAGSSYNSQLPATLGQKASASSLSVVVASDDAAIGAPSDAEAAGNGSIIAILKRIRTLLGGTLTTAASGNVAHDAVDSGNPLKFGGKAASSLPSAVADGDRVDAYYDLNGRLFVNLGTPLNDATNSIRATKQGALTDRSGSITTGGTAQQMMAANSSRRYLMIQNASVGALWINFTSAAVQDTPSIQIAAGGNFILETGFVSTEAVSVIGATTGQKWAAKEG